MNSILCSGSGPHVPANGVIGESDRVVTGMLCVLCVATAEELAPPAVDPTPAAQIDTAGLAAALADAKATPTLATLQAAIVALGVSIAPLT